MRIPVFLLFLLCAPAALAGVGVFTSITGETRIQRADAYLAAATGVEVEEDDIVETGVNAEAQMEMNDGTAIRLGANSRLLVSDYKLDGNKSVLTAGLEVLSGWMRFAVARLRGPDSRFDINTPTMTVGIRGTEGVIEAGNERGGLLLEEGEVAVRAPQVGSMPVRSGEYIERARGRPFARHDGAPAAFRSRMPPVMQARVVRRAHLLRERGVPPRPIRKLQREDRERYLQQHPHLQRRFEQRFRQSGSREKPGAPLRKPGPPGAQPGAPNRPELQHRREELQKQHELKKREELKKRKKEKDRERENNSSPPHGDSRDACGEACLA
jgi:hypothetical protein